MMLDFIIYIPGPLFLVIFVILEFIALLFAYFWMNFSFSSSNNILPNIKDMDIISIAALRGGENAVIKAVLFDMWQKGNIEINNNNSLKPIFPPNKNEERIAYTIYNSLQKTNNVISLFKDKKIKSLITYVLSPVYGNLERQGLIETENAINRAWQAIAISGSIILIVGLTKLVLGVFFHKPVIFLIISIIIGLVILFAITKPFKKYRPTKFGRECIKNFQKRYEWLKKSQLSQQKQDPIDNTSEFSPLFCVALFGLPLLASDPFFASFYNIFPKNDSSGGCSGGSCGGGSCSGGGCSGGCGGCGG